MMVLPSGGQAEIVAGRSNGNHIGVDIIVAGQFQRSFYDIFRVIPLMRFVKGIISGQDAVFNPAEYFHGAVRHILSVTVYVGNYIVEFCHTDEGVVRNADSEMVLDGTDE